MKIWQIMSKIGMSYTFQEAITPGEALRKYAVTRGYEDYAEMCEYLHISVGYQVQSETSKIILDS